MKPSLLDKLLRLFGTNEQRVRWKLQRWRNEREARRSARQNRDQHIKYRHKTCPDCGAVVDRAAKVCSSCDARLPSWHAQKIDKVMERLAPRTGSLTTVLLAVNGLLFLWLVLETGEIWGPDGYQSVAFGANFGPMMTAGGEWWRLITANFLHVGGLIHIGFNLVALAQIGPLVEEFYGTARATTIYLATGILSAVASHLWHPMAISGGASGAVMGVIGAGVIAGHMDGTPLGRALRNSLLRWVIFIALFGLIVPAVDNAGHFGGFAAGVMLGAAFKRERRTEIKREWAVRALATSLALITAFGLTLGALSTMGQATEPYSSSFRPAITMCHHALEHESEAVAAERCDEMARVATLFYSRHPYTAYLVAQLWERQGHVERAHRVVAIMEASGYRTYKPPGEFFVELVLADWARFYGP